MKKSITLIGLVAVSIILSLGCKDSKSKVKIEPGLIGTWETLTNTSLGTSTLALTFSNDLIVVEGYMGYLVKSLMSRSYLKIVDTDLDAKTITNLDDKGVKNTVTYSLSSDGKELKWGKTYFKKVDISNKK